MTKHPLFLLVIAGLLCCGSVSWAQNDEEIQLPAENSAEYWVVRSNAVSELTAFLTLKRKELNEELALFTQFLDKIGKTDDFVTASLAVPEDPKLRFEMLGLLEDVEKANIKIPEKPLTWEEMIAIAMRFTVIEGYLPVSFADDEELREFKTVLTRRENFLHKIRSDSKIQVEACLKAWFYLGTINQQRGFKLYRFQTTEAARKAEEQEKAKSRADKVAKAREKKQAHMLQLRQVRLRRKYYNNYRYWGW